MKVYVTGDGICVELHGREQFAALRAKVSARKAAITDVRFVSEFQDWRKWEVRMPGTAAPGLLLAGSYWTEAGWDFIYAKRPRGFLKPLLRDVLVIETTENRYRRIIIDVTPEQGQELESWWKNNRRNH